MSEAQEKNLAIMKGLRELLKAATHEELERVLGDVEREVGDEMTFLDKAALLLQALAAFKIDNIDRLASPSLGPIFEIFLAAKGKGT